MILPFRFPTPAWNAHSLHRLAALALGAFVFASLTYVDRARAAPEGKLDSMSLSLNTNPLAGITVIADPKQMKWVSFENTQISLSGGLEVEMKTGRIKKVGVFWGGCNGHNCFEMPGTPLLGSSFGDDMNDKEIDWNITIVFPANTIPVSTTGIAPSPHGDQIIAQCNQALQEGKTIHDEHTFTFLAPVTLGADTRIWKPSSSVGGTPFPGGGQGAVLGQEPLVDVDFSKTFHVSIPVKCEPLPEVEKVLPPFELLAATLHGDPAEYAGACPVGIKLFMSAKSNVKGPFEARVESKTGWKSEKYVYQTTESHADGTWSRHFQDTLTVPVVMPLNQSSGGGAQDAAKGIGNVQMNPKPEEPLFPGKGGIPKMGQVQTGFNPGNLHEDSLRLVVTGNGKTVMTDWWKYKITCDPQKAKIGDGAPSGVQQAVFVQQAFLALLPVAPKDGSKCGVTVSGLIQTNVKNVNVTFRLKNHQDNTTNAQTIKTSHANNIGKFVEYLDFSTSGQGSWVTPGGGWSLPGGGAGSQAGAKTGTLQIVVESPAKFEGNVASYNFTCYDPVPVGLQQPPTVKVDPAIPQVPGSVVGKGNDTTAQPDKQIVPPVPPIVCLGGTVKSGRCLCDGETVVIGGITSGGRTTYRCAAKPREIAKPTKPQPKPKLVCVGGTVRNDACNCQSGFAPVKTGATSFRCQRVAILPPPVVTPKPSVPTRVTTPQIACAGGVVRSNRCMCPGGMRLQNGVCRAAATSAPLRSVTPQRVR